MNRWIGNRNSYHRWHSEKAGRGQDIGRDFGIDGERKLKIINVDVSEKWATEKLSGRGRADDKKAEDIQKRLDWFNTDVVPAVEYYRNNSEYEYLKINGEQTIEQVHAEIMNKLGFVS